MVHGCACRGAIHREGGGSERENGGGDGGGRGSGERRQKRKRRLSNPVFTFVRPPARMAHIHIFESSPPPAFIPLAHTHGWLDTDEERALQRLSARGDAQGSSRWYFAGMQEAQLCRDVGPIAILARPRGRSTSDPFGATDGRGSTSGRVPGIGIVLNFLISFGLSLVL
ncbi:hypothetical protein KM043_010373 [Ampulex compressa]|nr:hypothetical protein KM043_010373 [Ampulex compressa]